MADQQLKLQICSGSYALLVEPRGGVLKGDPMRKFFIPSPALVGETLGDVLEGDPMLEFRSGWGVPCKGSYAKRSNQGECPGSGGRAGEERSGGGGDGIQGIEGGVGGGGHGWGSGNGRRGSRGRGHGGGNGGDDDNDGGSQFGYILNGGRGPRLFRMEEILLLLNVEIISTLEFLDSPGLSARARILRVVSFGFTSVALVCLSASIRQRGTNPRLASMLSWIGSVATFLAFISMISMALLASIIP